MDISYSSLPLVDGEIFQLDDYGNKTIRCDYDDSSSGYESTDVSDVESLPSMESRDNIDMSRDSRNNFLPTDPEAEVMNFQSTHALCEHLKLIISMPQMCDVTFLVGPRDEPVHGVRAILGTRSRVMYQLLLKHMAMNATEEEEKTSKKKKSKKFTCNQPIGIGRSLSQRLVIPVKKYDHGVFQKLIQFIHCGTVNITEETVAGLYCAASHFEIADLSMACLDFVERCLKAGKIETLLNSTRCYSEHKNSSVLFDKIYSVMDARYVTKNEERGETLV